MDDFDLEIKKEFIKEALFNLEEVEGSFMELESVSDPKPLLDKIFRLAHNLKGGSRAVGFGEVAEFTHQLENLVLKIQKGELDLSPELITVLLRSNDRLVEMHTELNRDLSATFNNSDLITDIQNWLNSSKKDIQKNVENVENVESVTLNQSNPEEVNTSELIVNSENNLAVQVEPSIPNMDAFFSDQTESVEDLPVKSSEIVVDENSSKKSENIVKNGKNTESTQKDDEIIRVNLSRIDLLNDYVGELIVLQSVVHQQTLSGNPIKLQASIRQLMKLSKDVQSLSMSLRMLPVKPLIQKLQRVVRDTALTLDKDVLLKVNGEQMDIDKSVLDRLADPLIHILRNAVDHGIESKEDRVRSGKGIQGHIELSFLNEGNHLVVEVRDDGKGINGDVLKKKAIEKKIISENQNLTDKQLIHLIFHPGFSTKSETSEISGRGVGMDVVKTNIEKIGGVVDVSTTIGRGSLFRLQIPLSLAVVDGLIVTCESNRYVIPLSQIQETVNLKSQRVHSEKLGIGSCFELRGSVVPMLSLDEALGSKKNQSMSDGIALIVKVEENLMALVVHDILRAQQIVIKPFANGIHPQKGWVGTCVLGDGLPTLILSPVDLLSGRINQKFQENRIGGVA